MSLSTIIGRVFSSSLVRFAVVAVAGLGIDLGTAWTLRTGLDFSLPLAAFFGFCAGAAFNYWLHERWTFGTRAASAKRGSLYLIALLVTVASRVGTVALVEPTGLPDMVVLIVATGVSFIVNFVLSRYVVFRPAREPETLS